MEKNMNEFDEARQKAQEAFAEMNQELHNRQQARQQAYEEEQTRDMIKTLCFIGTSVMVVLGLGNMESRLEKRMIIDHKDDYLRAISRAEIEEIGKLNLYREGIAAQAEKHKAESRFQRKRY
jgi:hypothetical protein